MWQGFFLSDSVGLIHPQTNCTGQNVIYVHWKCCLWSKDALDMSNLQKLFNFPRLQYVFEPLYQMFPLWRLILNMLELRVVFKTKKKHDSLISLNSLRFVKNVCGLDFHAVEFCFILSYHLGGLPIPQMIKNKTRGRFELVVIIHACSELLQ